MRRIKKLFGKKKDEFVEVILVEFVGLKSKMYSTKKKLVIKNIIQQKE